MPSKKSRERECVAYLSGALKVGHAPKMNKMTFEQLLEGVDKWGDLSLQVGGIANARTPREHIALPGCGWRALGKGESDGRSERTEVGLHGPL